MSLKDILSPNFNLHSATNKTSTSNGVNIQKTFADGAVSSNPALG